MAVFTVGMIHICSTQISLGYRGRQPPEGKRNSAVLLRAVAASTEQPICSL